MARCSATRTAPSLIFFQTFRRLLSRASFNRRGRHQIPWTLAEFIEQTIKLMPIQSVVAALGSQYIRQVINLLHLPIPSTSYTGIWVMTT